MIRYKINYFCDPVILRQELEKYESYFTEFGQLSLYYDPSRNLQEPPHLQCIGSSPLDLKDWNFTEVSPIFQNSEFIKLLDQVSLTIKRVKLMRMRPRSCYSLHQDIHKKLHWALVTFPECHMSFQTTNGDFTGFHIPSDGYGYLVNSQIKHTAINPTLNYRYHLVADVIE